MSVKFSLPRPKPLRNSRRRRTRFENSRYSAPLSNVWEYTFLHVPGHQLEAYTDDAADDADAGDLIREACRSAV